MAHIHDVLNFPSQTTERLDAAEARGIAVLAARGRPSNEQDDAELGAILEDLRKRRKWVAAKETLEAALESRDPPVLQAALDTVQGDTLLHTAVKKFPPLRKAVSKVTKLHAKLSAAERALLTSMAACRAGIASPAGHGASDSPPQKSTVTPEQEANLRHAISKAAEARLKSATVEEADTMLQQLNSVEATMQRVLNRLSGLTTKRARATAGVSEMEEALVEADAALQLASPDSELLEKVTSQRKLVAKLLGVRRAEQYVGSLIPPCRPAEKITCTLVHACVRTLHCLKMKLLVIVGAFRRDLQVFAQGCDRGSRQSQARWVADGYCSSNWRWGPEGEITKTWHADAPNK